MKTVIKLPIIAVAIALVPALAEAQRTPRTGSAAVGGDVGVFRPSDDALEPGLSLDGFYEFYMTPRSSLRLGVGWMNPDDDAGGRELRYIRVGGDLIYNWEGGTFHPFVGAGLGVYIIEPQQNGESIADSESKIGGSLLGGFEIFTSNTVSVKGEVSYHFISNVDGFGPANPDGLKVSVGLKKYF